MGAKAHELPRPLLDFRLPGSQLQGAAYPDGRVWYHSPKRGLWCADGADASEDEEVRPRRHARILYAVAGKHARGRLPPTSIDGLQ